MRKKKKSEAISTFLGPDSGIDGTLEFQGTVRLDGKLKGKIYSRGGTVIIGENAVINADIAVTSAIIMGKVSGTVDATEKIEVYPPGRVVGDMYAPVISIDSGATFNGNCGMKSRQVPVEKKSDSSAEFIEQDKDGRN